MPQSKKTNLDSILDTLTSFRSLLKSPFRGAFFSQSSKHHKSQTVRARELKFWENVHPPPCVTCQVSSVTCPVSHGRCHISGVMCQVSCHMSHVTCQIFIYIFFCHQQDLSTLVFFIGLSSFSWFSIRIWINIWVLKDWGNLNDGMTRDGGHWKTSLDLISKPKFQQKASEIDSWWGALELGSTAHIL